MSQAFRLHVYAADSADAGADQPGPPRHPRHLPKFLSDEQIDLLLRHARYEVEEARSKCKRHAAWRDEIMVLLGLFMGLRVSEIVGLDVENLDFGTRQAFIRGKGSRDRYVPIHKCLVQPLTDWIAGRESGPMFGSGQADRINAGTVQWRYERLGLLAGLSSKLKTHTLRHTAATRLLRKTKNLLLVQRFLGHASIANSVVYTHLETDEVRDGVDLL